MSSAASEDLSLQFVTPEGVTIGVERTVRDETLDVAVLYLAEGVPGGLSASEAVEGASWSVDSRPLDNDPRLTGTVSTTRHAIRNRQGHDVSVLQLHVDQILDNYEGYSGSAVVSDTGSAIGILVEAVLTRLSTPIGQGKPATNVLYAVPIDAALSQLGLAAAQEPTPRCVQFEEALRESYSRCVAQWQALGVPRATADELAHDPAVGDFPSELRPHADSPLRIVVGDIGSGKSLGAIRFFQQALRDATTSTSAPIPVFLHTADLSGDLSRDIALKCAGLGDPKSRGSRICIDITEGVGFAIGDLLLQARTIAGAWHNTLVLISSRPSAAFDDAEETRRLGALSEAEVESLLTRTLGRPLRFNLMEKLSEPVKSAIQRPLFALLLSTYLRAHDTHVPRSVGELITDLVERSFQLSKLTESMQQASLYRLARQISDNGGKPVPSREFAARTVVDELLRSHPWLNATDCSASRIRCSCTGSPRRRS